MDREYILSGVGQSDLEMTDIYNRKYKTQLSSPLPDTLLQEAANIKLAQDAEEDRERARRGKNTRF